MTFQEIKNFISGIEDPVARLEFVMDLGRDLLCAPETAVCTEIVGCSSLVEICRDGDKFYGRADSVLVRGLVAIILSMVDGKTPDEIRKMPMDSMFADLKLNLGASRLNGVNSIIRFFKNL